VHAGVTVHWAPIGGWLGAANQSSTKFGDLACAYRPDDPVDSFRPYSFGSTNVRFIGAPGFEPGTSPTRTVRATRLRHAPRVSDYPRPARVYRTALIAASTCLKLGPS
jgi:hypothetical protein